MTEFLTIELPDGRGWEMPRYLAKKLLDFIKQKEDIIEDSKSLNYEAEWLQNLHADDQAKVIKR